MLEHPVVAAGPQPAQRDPVPGHPALAPMHRTLIPAHAQPAQARRDGAFRSGAGLCRGGLPPAGRDPDRVGAGRGGVHAHAPGPGGRRQRGHRERGLVPALGGPRLPVRVRQQRPRKLFLDAPTSSGNPGPARFSRETRGRSASSAQLCSARLANPMPGVDHDPGRVDARADRRVGLLRQFGADLGDHVGVAGQVAHDRAGPAPVHDHVPGRRGPHHRVHTRVGQAAADVVDHDRAGRRARPRPPPRGWCRC